MTEVEQLKKEIAGLKAGHKTLTAELQFAHVRLNRAFDDAWHGKAVDRATFVEIKNELSYRNEDRQLAVFTVDNFRWLIEQLNQAHRHIEQIKQKLQLKKHEISQYQKNSWANYCRQVVLDKKRRRTVEFNQILRQKLKDLKAKNHELRLRLQGKKTPLASGAQLDELLADFGFERWTGETDCQVRLRFVEYIESYGKPNRSHCGCGVCVTTKV